MTGSPFIPAGPYRPLTQFTNDCRQNRHPAIVLLLTRSGRSRKLGIVRRPRHPWGAVLVYYGAAGVPPSAETTALYRHLLGER